MLGEHAEPALRRRPAHRHHEAHGYEGILAVRRYLDFERGR